MNTIIKRVPRPLGITLRLKEQTKNKEDKLSTKITLIDQWSGNNMRLNGEVYTVEQLAMYLELEPNVVMKYMWKSLGKMGKIIGKKDAGEIAREIFGIALKKGLESHALIQSQAAILMSSQGQEYKPFLSSAVNQALGNLNAAQAPILALLKVLTDKQETNIIINQGGNTTNNQYVTTEQALTLINKETRNLPESTTDPDIQALEFAQNTTMPDTNPRTQNIQFINTPKLTKDALSSNPLSLKVPLSHEDRRERIEDIIEDEADFIL